VLHGLCHTGLLLMEQAAWTKAQEDVLAANRSVPAHFCLDSGFTLSVHQCLCRVVKMHKHLCWQTLAGQTIMLLATSTSEQFKSFFKFWAVLSLQALSKSA